MTAEQKYHSAQTLLHQWLSEYAKKHPTEPTSHLVKVHTAAIELDLQTQNLCFEKIKEIMELHYSDIKNTPVFKLIQKNLEEVSKDYIKCLHYPLTKKSVDKFHNRAQTFNRDWLLQIHLRDQVHENQGDHQVRKTNLRIR